MEIIRKDNINRLSEKTGESLISIYLPTHRTGREVQQDPIRFKNKLDEAEQRLQMKGMRKPEIESLLKQARSLAAESNFWQHQSDGLVVFISRDFMEYFRLPIRFEELLIVSDRFHIKPMLPILSKNGHFYLLGLSQNLVRFFEGTLFNIDEIKLEEAPTSLQQALWFDDPERQLQYHTRSNTSGTSGTRPAIFHGQGVSEEDSKTNLLRFFQKVNDGVMEILAEEQAPLVLAGVDYLLPIYRNANSYPYVLKEGIQGNPDELSPEQLHQRAWVLVEPIFKAEQDNALEQYRALQGSNSPQASSELNSIILAAFYGRVETLFVALGKQIWGTFNSQKSVLEVHREHMAGAQDLLDLAAVKTLSNGGEVYALDRENMPDEVLICAIFRYAY